MTRPVFVINGPNLNMLGVREPEIYGRTTLADVEARCHEHAVALGLTVDFRQTNSETTLVDWTQEAVEGASGIIINPAGYSFSSIPILDALKIFRWPIVELHISNIHRREEIYHQSYVSRAATAVIAGAGTFGYIVALDSIHEMLRHGEPEG